MLGVDLWRVLLRWHVYAGAVRPKDLGHAQRGGVRSHPVQGGLPRLPLPRQRGKHTNNNTFNTYHLGINSLRGIMMYEKYCRWWCYYDG